MNLKEACNNYMDYVIVTRSKGTADFYDFYTKKLLYYFGEINISQIDNMNILKFIRRIKEDSPGITNNTLNKAIQTLKTVLKYNGVIIEFSKLKERKKQIFTISEPTIKRIFDYYEQNHNTKKHYRNYLYMRLLNDTGLRVNEMNHLSVQNISIDMNLILVTQTKTNLDRYVIFTDKTKEVLKKYLVMFQPTDYLFFKLKDRQPLSVSIVQSFISRLKKRLHIQENITPHKWRHTFATRFVNNNGDLETLRLLLGHTNLKTTQKYLHLSKDDLLRNYRKTLEVE